METVNVKTRVDRLKKVLTELDFQIQSQNDIINKSEMEIVKRNAIIERKQNQVDLMNKKLNQMIAAAGVSRFHFSSCCLSVYDNDDAVLQRVIHLQPPLEKGRPEIVYCRGITAWVCWQEYYKSLS